MCSQKGVEHDPLLKLLGCSRSSVYRFHPGKPRRLLRYIISLRPQKDPILVIRSLRGRTGRTPALSNKQTTNSVTKRVVENRELLSDENIRAQKLITSVVKSKGGTENVPITTSMLNDEKFAASGKKEADQAARELKRKADKS